MAIHERSHKMRYYILFVIVIALYAFSTMTKNNVYVHINAPELVEAGTVVDVEVELHKSQVDGFARFRQELPHGVTASPVYPANMNFSFEDNAINMIWLNLPDDDVMTIRYQLMFHERLKGDLVLDGTFSYIDNNQRRSSSAPSKMLAINPSPGIDERLLVDVNEASRRLLAPAPAADPGGRVFALRQDPVPGPDHDFVVNVLVNKGELVHFAKMKEVVPDGFTAEVIDSYGGEFSFDDNMAQIVWDYLPIEESFLVSYRLISEYPSDGIPELEGDFSFMDNNITATRKTVQTGNNLIDLDVEEKEQLIASVTPDMVMPSQPAVASVQVRNTTPGNDPVNTGTGNVPDIAIGKSLEAEEGVYYRVQLAAGKQPVDPESYFRSFDVAGDVRAERHEGWIKYSIGSYYDYRSARDSRTHIWSTTRIDDAFVTAYNNGSRITVQEALMIANHQWYR